MGKKELKKNILEDVVQNKIRDRENKRRKKEKKTQTMNRQEQQFIKNKIDFFFSSGKRQVRWQVRRTHPTRTNGQRGALKRILNAGVAGVI